MATQFQVYLYRFLPFISFWILLFMRPTIFNSIPLIAENRALLLVYSPLIVVATLGIYAVATVLYGVATFNDCQRAKEALVAEIAEAKEDLRKRKIIE